MTCTGPLGPLYPRLSGGTKPGPLENPCTQPLPTEKCWDGGDFFKAVRGLLVLNVRPPLTEPRLCTGPRLLSVSPVAQNPVQALHLRVSILTPQGTSPQDEQSEDKGNQSPAHSPQYPKTESRARLVSFISSHVSGENETSTPGATAPLPRFRRKLRACHWAGRRPKPHVQSLSSVECMWLLQPHKT